MADMMTTSVQEGFKFEARLGFIEGTEFKKTIHRGWRTNSSYEHSNKINKNLIKNLKQNNSRPGFLLNTLHGYGYFFDKVQCVL